MIQVVIADDHPIVRQGVRTILAEADDVGVLAEAGDAAELLRILQLHRCDVVILDVRMPGMNGLEALSQLREQYPDVRYLILSFYPEDPFGIRALRAGAHGYLPKEAVADELVDAVRRIAAGRRYITSRLAELLATQVATVDRGTEPELSAREEEVMLALAAGRTVSEIARELNLSVKTVSTHRAHVLEKLGLANNAELMRYALDQGLTGEPSETGLAPATRSPLSPRRVRGHVRAKVPSERGQSNSPAPPDGQSWISRLDGRVV